MKERVLKVKKVKPLKTTKEQKRKYWIVFILILAFTLSLEFFIEPHPHFGIDGTAFFYAGYGFVSCIAIIAVSKFIGMFLKRPETYYQGDEE